MKSSYRILPYLLLWLFSGIAIVIYIRSICLAYLYGGPITDDSVDLLGAIQHLDLYTKLFTSNARQTQVVMDLGFYGQVPKFLYLIPWIIFQKILYPKFSLEELSAVYQASWYTPPENISSFSFSAYVDPLQYLYTHIHLHNTLYLFGLLILAGASSYAISNAKLAIPLSITLILTFPYISGLSLFNSKDLPVAFFYTLFSLACALSPSRRYQLRISYILVILSASILTSLKVVFWPVTAITLIGIALSRYSTHSDANSFIRSKELRRSCLDITLIAIISVVLNPYLLAHPLPRILEAFRLFANHSNFVKTAVNGQVVSAADHDWSTFAYINQWISIITPTYILVLAVTAYILMIYLLFLKPASLSARRLHPFLAQSWLMPLLAILNNSNVYDGIRHFTFALVSNLIIVAAVYGAYLNQKGSDLLKALFSISIVLGLILPLGDTLSLSPYQYTYKNEYSRSSPSGIYSDADFWLFGAKELLASITQKDLRISHFDGSSWDYSRLWIRYFGQTLDQGGQTLYIFDRGEKLLRQRYMSCDESYNLIRQYWLGSPQLVIGSATNCLPK